MGVIKSYKKYLIVCFVSVLLVCCFHHFVSRQIPFIKYSNGFLAITDYAYYIILVKAFWFEGLGNIYELSFQQQALATHVGSQINMAMPMGGITPIGLVVWLPFAYVARFSMSLSYTLWITFSVGILLIALWNGFRYASQFKKPDLLPITLSFATLFSWNMLLSICGGQTSFLAAGVLMSLFYIVYKTVNESRSSNCLLITLLIFVLGIKPQYFALGLGLLIIFGMWRDAIYSIALVIVFFIGVTSLLTVEWMSSYLNLLRIYSQGSFPDVYAWSITIETMNIFRSAFRNFIGDNIVVLISNIVTCSVYMGVMGLSILAKIRGKSIEELSPLRVTKEQLFVLLVASYLLFAPSAGAYEDILLLPVFITVLYVGNTPPLTSYKSFVLVSFVFVILLHNFFRFYKPIWLFWSLKAVILFYMLKFCRSQNRKKNSTEYCMSKTAIPTKHS